MDSQAIYTLGRLEPFISLHKLFVTPIIAFLAQPAILNSLKASEAEVSHIFSHPLEAILDPTLVNRKTLVAVGSNDWPYQFDVYVRIFLLSFIICVFSPESGQSTGDAVVQMLNTPYRMHRFRTSASPIKGLTADILVCLPPCNFLISSSKPYYDP
jgi:hypothetical protein